VSHAIEIAKLNQKIGKLTEERDYYASRSERAVELCHVLNGRMEDALERLRPYAFNCQENLIAWHKYYNELLQKERDDNLQLRLQMDDKMASIRRANDIWRGLQEALLEIKLPYITKIAEYKAHIRFCRNYMGWSPDPEFEDSDAEEEKKEDEVPAMTLGDSATTGNDN